MYIPKHSFSLRLAVTVVGIVALGFVLLLSGCSTTIRTTTDMFQTGRPLASGKTEIGARSDVYPLLPLTAYVEHGFNSGFQLDAGYGLHGVIISGGSGGNDVLSGPEVYLTKEILNLSDILYLSATAGAELNFTPSFDAMLHAGIDAGVYPVRWLSIFADVRGLYLVGGIPGMELSAGVGIDGPFTLKIAGFYTPVPVLKTTASSGDVLWPAGVSMEMGFTF